LSNTNPFPQSHKYAELLKIYADMAKNGCFNNDGSFVPANQVFGMSGQVKFKEILKKLLFKYDIETLLDYGAGQGSWENKIDENNTLRTFLKLKKINFFEPARKLNKKIISECVVSFDVLEHVFISDVPWVIYDIFSHSSKLVIINVACYPAIKILPNKENVHITVRDAFWWKGMIDGIANFFPNINYVLLASKTYKEVTIFEDVSRKDYLKVNGYMALKK
jgi:hypothetical protein